MANFFHLKSTTTSGTWNAHAVANETVGSGVDVEVFFPKYDPDVFAMVGFVGSGTEPTSYTQLLHAAYLQHSSLSVLVYESGGYKGAWAGMNWGSRASVHRNGTTGAITYREDGNVVYTSLTTNTGALEIAVSIYNGGSTATELEAVIGGVTKELSWGYNSNVEITEDSSHAAGSPVYNNVGGTAAGTYSGSARADTDVLADKDVIYSCVYDNQYSRHFFGLVDVNEDITGFAQMNFSIFIYPSNSEALVYESGVLKNTESGIDVGDEFSVRRNGTTGAITYYRNDTLMYTSAATSTAAHSLATSIFDASNAIWRAAAEIDGGAKTPLVWEAKYQSQEWEDYWEAYLNTLPTPDVRLTQAPVEVIGSATGPTTRLTQAPVEVIGSATGPTTRLTQFPVEVIYKVAVPSKVTQQVAEISIANDASSIEASITHSIAEVLITNPVRQVSSQVSEVSVVSDASSVETLSTQSLAEVLVAIVFDAYHVSQQVTEITYSNDAGSVNVLVTQLVSETLLQLALAPPSYITQQVAEISYSNTASAKVSSSQSIMEILVRLYAGSATDNAVQYIAIMS